MEDEGRLTKAQRWIIAVTILVVVIATGLNLLVRRWYSADLRYEENPYYILKGQAVTSCLVKNYGRSPVNEVRISVEFLSKILDIQISPEFGGKIVENGVGQQNAVIELERIVPKDQVTIFFAVEQLQKESIIRHIASKEMLGRTGQPVLSDPLELLRIFNLFLTAPLIFFLARQLIMQKKGKIYLEEAMQHVEKAKQINKETQDERDMSGKMLDEIDEMRKQAAQALKEAKESAREFTKTDKGQPKQLVDKND